MDRQQSLADRFSAPNSKLFAIQNFLPGTSCNRMRKARPTVAHGTDWNQTQGCVRPIAPGCEGEGRLHCDSNEEMKDFNFKQSVSLQAAHDHEEVVWDAQKMDCRREAEASVNSITRSETLSSC